MNELLKTKQVILVGACVLAVTLIPNWEDKIQQLQKFQVLGSQQLAKVADINPAPELIAIADNPIITAKAALAYDFQSGSILYTYNFDDKLPIASLTKLVTALVVLDSNKFTDVVEVKEEDTKVIGPNLGLVAQERLQVGDLLKSMLIASHNDAALTLARHTAGSPEKFAELMNKKTIQLGLQNTHFTNPVGFDDLNHYSTAHDITLILKKFLSIPELEQIVKTKELEIIPQNLNYTHKVKTTNKLLLEDDSVVGVKTGFTTEAKGNLVIRSVKDKADVVTIVLGSEDREGDTRKILDWIHTVYRW